MPGPDFSRLLSHPDTQEITSKLLTGIPAKDVSDWLKLKYNKPEEGHLRLPASLLKIFIESNLDLYKTMSTDLEKIKSGAIVDKQISASLKNNKTYRERLEEAATTEVDINKTLSDAINLMKVRAEQVFDKIQENPSSFKPDYALIKWFELILGAVEKYDKIINKSPDHIVQHNVSVQMVDQYTIVFQDAIKEVLSEMDPELSFYFVEKLNEKMAKLKLPEQEPALTQEKRLTEAKLLASTITSFEDKNAG